MNKRRRYLAKRRRAERTLLGGFCWHRNKAGEVVIKAPLLQKPWLARVTVDV